MTGRGKGKRIRRGDTQWRALLSRLSASGLTNWSRVATPRYRPAHGKLLPSVVS